MAMRSLPLDTGLVPMDVQSFHYHSHQAKNPASKIDLQFSSTGLERWCDYIIDNVSLFPVR